MENKNGRTEKKGGSERHIKREKERERQRDIERTRDKYIERQTLLHVEYEQRQ